MASLFGNVLKRRRWCPECERHVLAEEAVFNNTGHAALNLFTCGLWLPFAIIAVLWHGIAHSGYYCPACGCRCR